MRNAFNMLELVFVIVVAGILSAAIIPRMERDALSEAAEQVLSHINLTRHLAMSDNVYDDTDTEWYEEMWRISFRHCTDGGWYYTVFSDKDHEGNADTGERAIDPLTRKELYSSNSCTDNPLYENRIQLSRYYDIDDIELYGSCFTQHQYVAFDYLGRPHAGLSTPSHVATGNCRILLTKDGEYAEISIERESGFTRLSYGNS